MKHELDEKGVCWKVRTVKGDDAWILCGRASYEAVTRCDEHNKPLTGASPAPAGSEKGEA